jgi:hypothetical protein
VAAPQTPVAALATQAGAPDSTARKDRLSLQKDVLQVATDNRIKTWTGVTQALGGAALAGAGGLLFAWRSQRTAWRSASAACSSRNLAEWTPITARSPA